MATAYLLRRLISQTRVAEPAKLIERVHDVGQRLVAAQPLELVVGNIVRRVIGLIRDEEDEKRGEGEWSGLSSEAGSGPQTPQVEVQAGLSLSSLGHAVSPQRDKEKSHPASRPPLISSHTGPPGSRHVTSMFNILSHPTMKTSAASTPGGSGATTPQIVSKATTGSELRAEIMEGISEIIDELEQCDDQIAGYATDHIHAGETIFTYSSSLTVQRFLLKAASKRKFTVIHAEAYPNNHQKTHALVTGNFDPDSDDDNMTTESFQKPLISAGVTVILIPDSAIFALMARANKCILGARAVLVNGSLLATAGSTVVAKAARHHHVPVVVLCGTYKLSPSYPYDPDSLIEHGEVGKVISYQEVEMRDKVHIRNPLTDFVDAENVDLFVTNLGGCATGYMYRVVRDQYRDEDIEL